MEEKTLPVILTESDACRIIWALNRFSSWLRQSAAPQTRKDRGIEQNNAIIDRIRGTFKIEEL